MSRFRPLLATVLVGAVLAGCGQLLIKPGQTPRPTPSPSPTFTLDETGFDAIVIDEAGEPIPEVRIQIRIGARTGSAQTTAEGTFFDRGNLGLMRITASKEGFVTVEETLTVVPNEVAELEIVLVAED